MRRVLAALLLTFLALPATAQGQRETCEAFAELAAEVMAQRLAGAPRASLEAASHASGPDLRPLLDRIVAAAWETEAVQEPEAVADLVFHFSQEVFDACMAA